MAEEKIIEIPKLELKLLKLHIVGDTSLIVHAWSEKAKKEMLDREMGKAKSKSKDVRNPEAEFIDSMYWLTEKPKKKTKAEFDKAVKNGARFGFPSSAIKESAVAATYRAEIEKNKVKPRGAIHIKDEFIEIKPKEIVMREDMVQIGGAKSVADLRYRAEFVDWESYIDVVFNSGVYTADQVINMLNLGGFACGLGEWRVEKGGNYGSFHVDLNNILISDFGY